MEDTDKLQLVQTTSAIVFLAIALTIGSIWCRVIVSNFAMSPSLRKSFKLTRKNIATSMGAILTCGIIVAVLRKDGNLRTASSLFAWHPISMTAATTLLFPASFDFITMRHAHKSASTRKNLVALHAFVQLCSCVILGLGFAAIYFNKPADKHFLSLHSWVGMIALGLVVCNECGGMLRSANLPLPKLSWKDPLHVLFGKITFFMLCLATALGLYNKVMILPDGLDGSFAAPSMDWLAPGGTWAYGVIGGTGVYLSLAFLFWICYFALGSNVESPETSSLSSKKRE